MKLLPESKRETHVAATMPSTYISARSMTMHEHEKSSTCPVHWPWRPCPYVHLLNMSVKIPAICHTSPLSSTLSLQPCASMPHGRSPPPPHASPATSPTPELIFLSFFSLGPGRYLSFSPCRGPCAMRISRSACRPPTRRTSKLCCPNGLSGLKTNWAFGR